MQAICNGDYKFAPAEYWAGVSETAKAFVGACLTVDPVNRPTAADLLNHPWLKSDGAPFVQDPEKPSGESVNLLPNVKKAFDAKKTRSYPCAAVTDASSSRCSGHDDGQPATGTERTAPEHGWHARGGARATAQGGCRFQGGGREGGWYTGRRHVAISRRMGPADTRRRMRRRSLLGVRSPPLARLRPLPRPLPPPLPRRIPMEVVLVV